MSSPIFFPMLDSRRLAMMLVVIMISAASVFSGDSEPALERMCATHASADACRRL
jgi:hypothetical protein